MPSPRSGHHSRVCTIDYRKWRFQDSLLEEFAAMDEPFLALTSLQLAFFFQQRKVPVLPDLFLGASAIAPFERHSLSVGWEAAFIYRLTLSGFPFAVFPILDIFHPRRSSLVCHCCLGSSHLNLDSNTLDLRPIEQADTPPPVHSCSPPQFHLFRLQR